MHKPFESYQEACKAAESDNPDQLWDDYKDGYRDIDGEIVEPDWIEPDER